jgi:cell division protein FtsB
MVITMITRHRKKSVLRRLLMPLVAVGFLSYFGYHAFNGAFGIWAMDRLEADGAQLTVTRDRLVAERTTLERQVASVRPSSLDADVIDLEARHALNLMRPDEVVVSLGAAQQSAQ